MKLCHANICVKCWLPLVYLYCRCEILSSLIELLLLQTDVAQSPPSVIVAEIGLESFLIELLCRVKVFVWNILMASKGMSIRKLVVYLNSASEKFESCFMLFLQRVAVSYNTPGFRSKQRFLKDMVAEMAQVHLFLQMPQACRVVLHSFQPTKWAWENGAIYL